MARIMADRVQRRILDMSFGGNRKKGTHRKGMAV